MVFWKILALNQVFLKPFSIYSMSDITGHPMSKRMIVIYICEDAQQARYFVCYRYQVLMMPQERRVCSSAATTECQSKTIRKIATVLVRHHRQMTKSLHHHLVSRFCTHCNSKLSGGLSEPPHDKTNKMAFAPSKDSDQPGHPPSLIRVFAVRFNEPWVLSYPLSASEDSDQTGRMPRLF